MLFLAGFQGGTHWPVLGDRGGLGKLIDQKLQRIYDLANRRLSPKVTQENRGVQAKERTQRGRRNDYGKAATTPGLRLHFKCLDDRNPGLHL